jgi:hypothetical protein
MDLYKFYSKPAELLGAKEKKYLPWGAFEQATKGKKLNARQLAAIASHPRYAYLYAINFIQGRWPEGEAVIASDPFYAYYYALYVIKDRWPEGEATIYSNPVLADEYNDFLNSLRK